MFTLKVKDATEKIVRRYFRQDNEETIKALLEAMQNADGEEEVGQVRAEMLYEDDIEAHRIWDEYCAGRPDDFEEAFQGYWSNSEAYAYYLYEDLRDDENPLLRYIDWEAVVKDMEASGEYLFEKTSNGMAVFHIE